MEESQQMFDIDAISIFIVDEKAEIRDDYVETADLELLLRLHDNSDGTTYNYHVWVECDYRDDWRIYMLCSENGRAEDYPPFKSIEDPIEKMIRLFLGDFMVYFNRAYAAGDEEATE